MGPAGYPSGLGLLEQDVLDRFGRERGGFSARPLWPCRPRRFHIQPIVRTTVAALGLLPLTAACGGLGFLRVSGPPAGHEEMTSISCTESKDLPNVDLAWGGLTLVTAAGIAGGDPVPGKSAGIALYVAWTVFSGFSAVEGYRKVNDCLAAKELLARRLAAGPQRSPGEAGPGTRLVFSGSLDSQGTVVVDLPAAAGTITDPPVIACYVSEDGGNEWYILAIDPVVVDNELFQQPCEFAAGTSNNIRVGIFGVALALYRVAVVY